MDLGLQDSTNTLSVGTTGDWQNWQNFSAQVTLYQGANIVRVNIINGSGNYNYFDIQPFEPTATPTPVTPTATPIPTNTPVPPTVPPPVTITLYSNANHDGYIRENNGTGNGANNQVNNGSDRIFVGDNDDNWDEQYIGIVSFDTSSIPANATITNVELWLRQESLNGNPFGSNNLGDLYADIGTANGFSGSYTLQATDFQNPAANNNVILLDEPTGDGDWADGTMNGSFYGLINRNGYTQFKIHFEFPDDGDGNRDRFRFFSGDNGQSDRPRLIITYTVP